MNPQEWIAHDPDPVTAAELAACPAEQLAARFDRPLRFGTAGLRGPVGGGPDAMNIAVVLRASWAVARVLGDDRDNRAVVIGYDARHRSGEFATATADVFAAAGFSVLLLPAPVPTPVVAFAVRAIGAAAGIQITASHNPASDNGYKVYADGGRQIIAPTDTAIETAITTAPPADRIARQAVEPSGADLIERYVERAAAVRRGSGSVRVALTPLHGVGGDIAVETLRRAGFGDIHTVATQFVPDPEFPTVAFPNPEEPGAIDALLALATDVDADVAVALDPDADRCAIGVPTATGWRMLSGDETGWLFGDYILSNLPPGTGAGVSASTVVSSRMLAAIAAHHGAAHVETLTGFKWLSRADEKLSEATLVYAYEEAIGHCVDPAAVRDKDGISAAVLACDLVAALRTRGHSATDALDALAYRHGLHAGAAVSRRFPDIDAAIASMARLREDPPDRLAGYSTAVTDLLHESGDQRTDALIITGGDDDTLARVVVRPSGTEPKLKCYIEVRLPVTGDLARARAHAERLRDDLVETARRW